MGRHQDRTVSLKLGIIEINFRRGERLLREISQD
jgi:hypothetical protein